jgi:hypothetical protein
MTRLSDTQLTILSVAAQRADGNLLPLPGSLRGGAAGKVVGALLSRGLAREKIIDSTRTADPALNTVWRNHEDGRGVLLLVTGAGLQAIGIEAGDAEVGAVSGKSGSGPVSPDKAAQSEAGPNLADEPEAAATGRAAPQPRKTREGTKQAALIAMLRRPGGATIAEIVAATGWQPHTVRGALAGALKKRLGLEVTSEKIDGRGRVYTLA